MQKAKSLKRDTGHSRPPSMNKFVPYKQHEITRVLEVELHSFLTSAQYGGEWSALRPGLFTLRICILVATD
jgi:hypothetical protein